MKNKDLTVGEPSKLLWAYSMPMFLSVVFQQVYNIADSVIAGKYAGTDALAAVGASYPITMIFMAVAIGANVGSSVVISQLFFRKRPIDSFGASFSNAGFMGIPLEQSVLGDGGVFYGIVYVVVFNLFAGDTDEEMQLLRRQK